MSIGLSLSSVRRFLLQRGRARQQPAALAQLTPSPIVELNRAVAVGMAFGVDAALPLLDALAGEPALRGYHLLPAARADMLERAGRQSEAAQAWREAANLAGNARERDWLLGRAAALEDAVP